MLRQRNIDPRSSLGLFKFEFPDFSTTTAANGKGFYVGNIEKLEIVEAYLYAETVTGTSLTFRINQINDSQALDTSGKGTTVWTETNTLGNGERGLISRYFKPGELVLEATAFAEESAVYGKTGDIIQKGLGVHIQSVPDTLSAVSFKCGVIYRPFYIRDLGY